MSALQGNRKNAFEESGSNVFNKLLFRYLPYWPLFLAMLVLSLIVATIYLRYTIPIYQSQTTILIKDEKKGMDDSQLLEGLNMLGSSKIVENEIEVIRSRGLVREVVKKLGLYAPIVQEGSVISKQAYTISPIHIRHKNPDSLVEASKIFFTVDNKSKKVNIGDKNYVMNEWQKTPYGELMFIPNKYYQGQEIKDPIYFSLLKVKRVTNGMVGRFEVAPVSKMGTVLRIRLNDAVPQRSEDILAALVEEYNKANINDKNALATNTLAFVEDRLHYVVRELDSVESRIQQYKTQKNIVDIGEQGRQFLQTVGANDQRVSELNVQMAVLDQVQQYVNAKGAKEGIVPSTLGVNDPTLSQLLEKLYNAESQYERLRKTTAENNPILVTLNEEIARIKPSIMENISAQKRNLEASKRNISSTNQQYSSMLRTIPTKERELLEISRQQSIKNHIYTFLLQKREETALAYASTVADSRWIDEPNSSGAPVSPKRPFIYTIAVLFGLAITVLVILIREVLNRNILFRKEIEDLTSVPIIGEIAFDGSKESIVIGEGNRNFIAEQFRQLRTSLGYLGINNRKKKILMTSTISGEGKSFVCGNLGVSLALTGKKVVLIELDLRKPKLANMFNVGRDVGISNYFIGDKEPDEIIKRLDVHPNLFIIPCGPIPPNPSELILNGKMQELLNYLDTIFDYIIIDTAPVSPVTDAYILSPMCDATLYVVRHGYTPKSYVQMLDHNNKVKGLKNLAIVFNGVKSRGIGRYDYGYGYGQSYGYGYGYEEGKSNGKKKKKSMLSFAKKES